jgi:hypothetical protein
MLFLNCLRSTRRSTLPNRIAAMMNLFCSDWLYARILRVVLYGRWLCGHCDLAQRRRVFLALALLDLGRMTSVSSGTAAGAAYMINRSQRILDFYNISELLAVDTEVDPPNRIA